MKKCKVLVIEDDPNICELIGLYAEKEGYQLTVAHNGRKGLEKYYEYAPDMIILDIMMPEMDGWQVCREIRKESQTPIIMLTGKGESYDKMKGFDMGTDDYVMKPFDPKELIARIKAVLRRTRPFYNEHLVISLPLLTIDLKRYKVLLDGNEIWLRPKEMEILYFLVTNANQVFSRQQLLDQIWGFNFIGDPRNVDVHVKRIREKMGEPNPYWELKTIRGVGYKFEVYAEC